MLEDRVFEEFKDRLVSFASHVWGGEPIETKKKPIWFHFSVQAIAVGFILYWHWNPPLPNKAVLGLATVAALMVLSDMRPVHKAIYILVLIAFVTAENKAIDHEHEETSKVFGGIAESIKSASTDNQNEFGKATVEMNDILSKTETVASLAKENLLNLTGGDSFAYVSPQNFSGDQFPGVVWNNGEQPLIGLTLTIAHTSDPVPVWGAAFYKPIFIGTVGPYDHAPIPDFIFAPRADPKNNGQDHYWIMLSAQNGTVSQGLYFRRDHKNPAFWAYSFQVTKQNSYKPQAEKRLIKPWKGSRTFTQKLLLYRAWSDDLAEAATKP